MKTKYKRVLQPDSSYEQNPCYDCIFGQDGECNAPQEVIDSDEDCGFSFSGKNYIYINDNND